MANDTGALSTIEIEQGLNSVFATLRGAEQEPDAVPVDADALDEQAEAEAGEVDGELEEEESESEATEGEDEFHLDLKVDGEELRITDRAEATRLAQLGKHFTKKNEELIRERQQFEAEVDGFRNDTQKRYIAGLQEVEQFFSSLIGDPPVEASFNGNETAYLRALKQYNEAAVAVEQYRAERQRATQELQGVEAQKLRRWAETQEQDTLARIPEWVDQSVREAEVRTMTDYARDIGVPPEAFGYPQLVNSAWFRVMLRDAARYKHAAQVGASEVKRVGTKEAAPGSGTEMRRETRDKRLRDAKKQVVQNGGKIQDIAPLAEQLLQRHSQLTRNVKR